MLLSTKSASVVKLKPLEATPKHLHHPGVEPNTEDCHGYPLLHHSPTSGRNISTKAKISMHHASFQLEWCKARRHWTLELLKRVLWANHAPLSGRLMNESGFGGWQSTTYWCQNHIGLGFRVWARSLSSKKGHGIWNVKLLFGEDPSLLQHEWVPCALSEIGKGMVWWIGTTVMYTEPWFQPKWTTLWMNWNVDFEPSSVSSV